jgi:hypothetical protein
MINQIGKFQGFSGTLGSFMSKRSENEFPSKYLKAPPQPPSTNSKVKYFHEEKE